MKLVNLTPHAITLHVGLFDEEHPYGDEKQITIEPSGTVARVTEESTPTHRLNLDDQIEVWVHERRFGEVEGLPEKEEGVVLLVSSIVASAATHRDDLYVPYPLIRDDEGKVIGAAGIAKAVKDDRDDIIHNMSLDLARLQGCHAEDSDYRGGSEIFPSQEAK